MSNCLFNAGHQHIEIREHLDATPFALIEEELPMGAFHHLLPVQKTTTRSLVVCIGASLLHLLPCHLGVQRWESRFMHTFSPPLDCLPHPWRIESFFRPLNFVSYLFCFFPEQ